MNTFQYFFAVSLIPMVVGCLKYFQKNHAPIELNHPVVLVIALDGFRSDYLVKFPKTVTLNSLWRSGPRVPYMEPVFPTNTFPNLHSIATGLYPESHGITDNFVYDHRLNKVIDGFSENPAFWNYPSNVLPVWIQNEMHGRGRHSACVGWFGCTVAYGKDKLLPTYFVGPSLSTSSWENNVESTIRFITDKSKPANLVFLYYPEPDSTEHENGINSIATSEAVSIADKDIKLLINSLQENGILEKVNIIILSDHGISDRTKNIHLQWLPKSPLVEHFVSGASSTYNIKAKQGKLDELYRRLKAESKIKDFSIWKKEEMNGPPFYYSKCDRILDIVISAKPGSNFNAETRGAGHGFSHLAPEMRSVFIATGPAFKKGGAHGPIKNIDVIHIIASILGFEAQKNNGSFERVRDLLHSKHSLI